MQDDHDHTHATHSATCDVAGCGYTALVHAHDAEMAADLLAVNLASHNNDVHGIETDPEKIKAAVTAKMKTIAN